MKTLKEFLEGVELPFMAEAFTDRSTERQKRQDTCG